MESGSQERAARHRGGSRRGSFRPERFGRREDRKMLAVRKWPRGLFSHLCSQSGDESFKIRHASLTWWDTRIFPPRGEVEEVFSEVGAPPRLPSETLPRGQSARCKNSACSKGVNNRNSLGAGDLVWICSLVIGQNVVTPLNLVLLQKKKKKGNTTHLKVVQDKKEVMLEITVRAGKESSLGFGG